ncbi:MAG: hypothetical protein KGQ42_02485 [Alphaproteobacteria bacterium]|nr:hypothetical protein [Alphaproteobacteria bacterium]MDE2339863.1 hypothetical protein [Alphaproteobacteria bacterium]
MKALKLTGALCAAGLGIAMFASAASAQKSVATPGNYWDVQEIMIEPGHTEQYLDFVKKQVMSDCDWYTAKGYELGCKIIMNVNKRRHEPDLIIIRMFKDMPSVAEMQRRQDEYNAAHKTDDHAMDADQATRTPIRKLGDNSLWQEMNFSK